MVGRDNQMIKLGILGASIGIVFISADNKMNI
jgi:hypothetical protein